MFLYRAMTAKKLVFLTYHLQLLLTPSSLIPKYRLKPRFSKLNSNSEYTLYTALGVILVLAPQKSMLISRHDHGTNIIWAQYSAKINHHWALLKYFHCINTDKLVFSSLHTHRCLDKFYIISYFDQHDSKRFLDELDLYLQPEPKNVTSVNRCAGYSRMNQTNTFSGEVHCNHCENFEGLNWISSGSLEGNGIQTLSWINMGM